MGDSHYLPVMLDMRGKKILLVGGGAIASEKIGRLLEFFVNSEGNKFSVRQCVVSNNEIGL